VLCLTNCCYFQGLRSTASLRSGTHTFRRCGLARKVGKFSPHTLAFWLTLLQSYVPYKYAMEKFVNVGSISKDHIDPSIFCVLTAKSKQPGVPRGFPHLQSSMGCGKWYLPTTCMSYLIMNDYLADARFSITTATLPQNSWGFCMGCMVGAATGSNQVCISDFVVGLASSVYRRRQLRNGVLPTWRSVSV